MHWFPVSFRCCSKTLVAVCVLLALMEPSRLLAQESPDSSSSPLTLKFEAQRQGEKLAWVLRVSLAEAGEAIEVEDQGLRVVVMEGDVPSATPMLGSLEPRGSEWVWIPRFRLRAGQSYRAEYSQVLESGERRVIAQETFQIPRDDNAMPPRLLSVSPAAGTVPENLLRVYLEFDQPMSRGFAAEGIRLIDDKGVEVELPFLVLDDELWNEEGTRLTLLLDPGRVKQGLKPHDEEGRALIAGTTYRVELLPTWMSASGIKMEESYDWSWQATPSDTQPPEWNDWRVVVPTRGTREPLVIDTLSPIDRGLGERLIDVRTAVGDVIEGRLTADSMLTRWEFVPEQTWEVDSIVLSIDPVLEDPAGNSLIRPFEIDLQEGDSRRDLPRLERTLVLQTPSTK